MMDTGFIMKDNALKKCLWSVLLAMFVTDVNSTKADLVGKYILSGLCILHEIVHT
jgi:hypothetical protein